MQKGILLKKELSKSREILAKYKSTLDIVGIIERIDFENSQDPNMESWDGKSFAKELLYSQRMTHWLGRMESQPSLALQIAARGQHICRWRIPREGYPMDRVGYLSWRHELKVMHSEKLNEILSDMGVSSTLIERVQFLVEKKNLKSDRETQLLEDVICLVFLEFYLDDFTHKHDEEKLIRILSKTWNKMSQEGHDAAMTINYSKEALDLINKSNLIL